MSEKLFEVVSEGRFEIQFAVRTMEDATGVLYTNQELKELYNDGEEWIVYPEYGTSCAMCVDSTYSIRCLIYLDDLISHVLGELSKPKVKEVVVDLSDKAINHLSMYCQRYLKQKGIMCRPSTGAFIRFKRPKVKLDVKKSVMSLLRSRLLYSIQERLNAENGISLNFQQISTIENQIKYIKFGVKLGITIDEIIDGLPFHREWNHKEVDGVQVGYYECYPLKWYLTNILFKRHEQKDIMIEKHVVEFRKWLEEIALL